MNPLRFAARFSLHAAAMLADPEMRWSGSVASIAWSCARDDCTNWERYDLDTDLATGLATPMRFGEAGRARRTRRRMERNARELARVRSPLALAALAGERGARMARLLQATRRSGSSSPAVRMLLARERRLIAEADIACAMKPVGSERSR